MIFQNYQFRIGILENEKLEGCRKVCELEEMLKQAGTVLATNDYNKYAIQADLTVETHRNVF